MSKDEIAKLLKDHDELFHFLCPLIEVSMFEPREKWVLPILRSNEAIDFKNQLLVAIEDYRKTEPLPTRGR